MKTNRTSIAKKARPSICTSTIVIAGMVLAQVNPLFVPSATAAPLTWLGTGTGGSWNDPANWSLERKPQFDDTARIDIPGRDVVVNVGNFLPREEEAAAPAPAAAKAERATRARPAGPEDDIPF